MDAGLTEYEKEMIRQAVVACENWCLSKYKSKGLIYTSEFMHSFLAERLRRHNAVH